MPSVRVCVRRAGTGCQPDYPVPEALHEDYGVPLTDGCHEVGESAVFARMWTNANVSVNCNNLSATIAMRDGRVWQSSPPTKLRPSSPTTTAHASELPPSSMFAYGGYGGRGFAID